MAEKMTIMVLKVIDLQCPCCYKKVKKILCKFPQIRNQVYDEKANTVTITVACCNPEKFRDKLCCKGSKVIISIEIKPPPPPQQPPPPSPPRPCCEPCSQGPCGGPCCHGYKFPPPPPPCYDWCYGYGYGQRGWYNIRCDYYVCEDNPPVCSIM